MGVGAREVGLDAGGFGVVVVGLVLGPGSDLSEEPAFQDVEPVTLDSESFLFCPPGPTRGQCCWWVSATRYR